MNDFEKMARTIDTAGLEASEGMITNLVIQARQQGAPAQIVDVLADTAQPEVARLRAFARLHAWASARLATPQVHLLRPAV